MRAIMTTERVTHCKLTFRVILCTTHTQSLTVTHSHSLTHSLTQIDWLTDTQPTYSKFFSPRIRIFFVSVTLSGIGRALRSGWIPYQSGCQCQCYGSLGINTVARCHHGISRQSRRTSHEARRTHRKRYPKNQSKTRYREMYTSFCLLLFQENNSSICCCQNDPAFLSALQKTLNLLCFKEKW